MERAAPIKNEALPQPKNHAIEGSATIKIDGGREIFGMNMIGRHRGHTAITRTPSNRGLQHEGLFQVDHVRPVESPINLTPVRASKRVALRGDEGRQKRNMKMWERKVRNADPTIIAIARRRRQHANIVPPLTQQRDHATRGRSESIPTRVEVIDDEQDLEPGDYPLRKPYTIRLGAPRSSWTRFFTPDSMD